MTLPAPSAYGLPADRFSEWREHQPDAVMQTIASDKRFIGINAPTGFGKTATAVTIARLLGGRACYVVETKPLQRQIDREMAGLVYDIRGKGNYDCHLLNEQGIYGAMGRCDKAEGLCETCELKDKGCQYFDRWRAAKRHDLVLTNYAYWLAINEYNEEGIGKFDLLILDEAHHAPDQLSKALRVELSAAMLDQFNVRLLPGGKPIAEWSAWAKAIWAKFLQRIDALTMQAGGIRGDQQKELRTLKGMVMGLARLASAGDDWIEDRNDRAGATSFEPIWPAKYREKLCRGVKKVVMMSAVYNVKTAGLLGIDKDEVEMLEFPSSFPVARRPMIYVKTVRMRAGMPEHEKLEMVRRIDQAQDRRMDRNGVIHSVSYERARYVKEHSRHANILMLPESPRLVQTTLDKFKERKNSPPWTLLGPSYDTGTDLPGVECEWQAHMKIPFPDTRNPIVRARVAADPDWGPNVAMVAVEQAYGRANRFTLDSCQNLMFDDNWAWFRWKYRHLMAKWFDEACMGPVSLPGPLAKLPSEREIEVMMEEAGVCELES